MRCFSIAMLILLLPFCSIHAEDTKGLEFFENQIRPVLVKHCYECHSSQAKKVKGELLVDTKQGLLSGGETGAAVVPGKPEESLLLSAIKHADFEMPPQQKLPKKVINDFEKWISMGAPDPRTSGQAGVMQKKIDLEAGRKFWAFQPIQHPAIPQVKQKNWVKDPLDAFILAKQEQRKIQPVRDADRWTLIRRLYFDLIGLPPSPEEVESFLNDKSDHAVEKVVDSLLASSHFGERWGRHWLDIAHYAESNGNVRNFTFPHAWRYRDWVIQAFNNDLPYDQFLTQQLAGDLLEGKTSEERNNQKTATGFLAMMSKPQNGKTFQMDLIAEEIEVSTRAFMALTVSCARCHDHKFDPIPTSDYYAMAGIFLSSDLLYGGTGANGSAPKAGLHVLETGDSRQAESLKKRQDEIAELQARIKELQQQNKNKSKNKTGKKGKKKNATSNKNMKAGQNAGQVRVEIKKLSNQLKQLQRGGNNLKYAAMGIREGSNCRDCQVYLKGEKPSGSPVPRGFVSVVPLESSVIPKSVSGRKEFAEWLTNPKHPLTSRVMVNRIWHHLFGAGIVRTVDNFGINGERPTHPELLDHLATRFMTEHQWSMKKMIRTIVLSRTYQLSADHDASAMEIDPENQLLWRRTRRRLEGEAIRDAILTASGTLHRKPPEGSIVFKTGDRIIRDNFTVDEFRVPTIHRSVYLPIIRSGIPEMLNVFDFAESTLVVGRRNTTTVPAQELYLMNSPFVIEQATAFAKSLLKDDSTTDEKIQQAYQRALARPASSEEVNRSINYLKGMKEDNIEEDKMWTTLCHALFLSAEFRYVQ